MGRKRYPIACICGSTRFKGEMEKANRELTMQGYIVVAPGVFAHCGDELDDRQKAHLDLLHLAKVEMADLVVVVNPGGYMGASTWNEVCHAKMLGKRTRFAVPLDEKVVDAACERRLEYAEQLAWESLDGLKHHAGPEGIAPDPIRNPSIKKGGVEFFDPWVNAEHQWDAWPSHDDFEQALDPFEEFGEKAVARFVARTIIGRGNPDYWTSHVPRRATIKSIVYKFKACPLADSDGSNPEFVVEIGSNGQVKATEQLRSRRTGRVVKGSSATRKLACDKALVARLLGLAEENAVLICGKKVAIPFCDAMCWVEFKTGGSSKCEDIALPKNGADKQILDEVVELVMKVAHEAMSLASQ